MFPDVIPLTYAGATSSECHDTPTQTAIARPSHRKGGSVMARASHHRKSKAPPQSDPVDNTGPTVLDQPVFSQPQPTPDPTKFEVKHPSDNPAYKQIDELNRE